MKGFFKNVFATIVGLLIILIIILVTVTAIINSESKYNLKDDSILCLNLTGTLKDRADNNPIIDILGLSEADEISLSDAKNAICKAKDNDKIKGIYIRVGYLRSTNASFLELRNELKSFKENGKFIIAYGDIYFQGSYFLSSIADKIIINPQGNINLQGMSASRMFYKGLFDKIGIEMQVFKVGTYKSAVEPYIQDKMSDANKEQTISFINDIWHTNLQEISESRHISIEKLNTITDSLPTLRDVKFVIENNLADTLMYETEVEQYLASLVGKKDFTDVKTPGISDMRTVEYTNRVKSDNKIAVLYAEGSISSGKGSTDIQDQFYIKQLNKLKEDKDVKGVVFRINSGGGSAYASEQIWKAVSELKKVKPIVVSMGGAAASGGYYIACNANKIVAQPSTLTGSIGIFGLFPNVENLTKQIGVSFDQIGTNKHSDFGDVSRPMSENERKILQEYINKGYDLFITRCAEGRNIPKDSINQIAQGRVWTGKQALAIGLVDELGGIDKAIEEAVKLAKVEKFEIAEYPKQKSFWEEFTGFDKKKLAKDALIEYFGEDYELIKTIKELKDVKEFDFIQARFPYNYIVK